MADAHVDAKVRFEILNGHPSFAIVPIEDYQRLLDTVHMTECDLRLSPQHIHDERNEPVFVVILTSDFMSLQYGMYVPDPDDLFRLSCPNKQAYAIAVPQFPDKHLSVLAGSTMALDEAPKLESPYKALRKTLVERGVVAIDSYGEPYTFHSDFKFASPSEAARVIAGYPIDGLREWKDGNGRSLFDHGLRRK